MIGKRLFVLALSFLLFIGTAVYAEEVSRAEYIQNLTQILGLDTELGKDYTAKDCAVLLNKKGFNIANIENLNTPISPEEKSSLINQLIGIRLKKRETAQEGIIKKAIVDEVKGKVQAMIEGTEKWIKVELGMEFRAGDILKTGPDSYVRLRVGKFGRVTIKENSELSLQELSYKPQKNAENIILNLAKGKAIIDVRDIEPDSRFEVRTLTTIAAVRGTVYSVEVINGGKMTTLE